MDKITSSFYIFTLLLAFTCCKKELPIYQVDDEGAVILQPSKWKYSLHASGSYHSNGYFLDAIIFSYNLAVPTTSGNGSKRMTMLNSLNGEEVWHWNDYFIGVDNNLDIHSFCKLSNLITWQKGGRSYCINLSYGSTKWKFQREHSYNSRLNPYGNSHFFSFSTFTRPDGFDESLAYITDITNGEISDFLSANYSYEFVSPYTDNGWIGGISFINETSNPDLLLVTYSEPLPEWKLRMMFGLYNTNTEEWVYERKQLVEPHWNAGVQNTPIIYNERVYAAAGNSIVCHDVMTGDQLWRRNFEQDFLFSGFIIEDGMLLANCEDTYTYRLDPLTGATIWRTKGAGTCSRMSYLNGVVYFVGGSTGLLHALDAETGRVLWRIDARRLGEPNGNFTTNAVYCIPGEGGARDRVVALTGRYAYCFEAAR